MLNTKTIFRSIAAATLSSALIGTAYGQSNSPPVLSFSTPSALATFEPGTLITVDVNASDSDGSISNVTLSIDGDFVRRENNSPYRWGDRAGDAILQNLAEGVHLLTAVATDNDGATSSESVFIEVTSDSSPSISTPENVPPVVSFSGLSDTYEVGSTLSVLVDATDNDGSIANVVLSVDGQTVRQENARPYQWGSNDSALQTLTTGVHTLTAVATDNNGATTTASVDIEMTSGNNTPEPPAPEPPPPVIVTPEPVPPAPVIPAPIAPIIGGAPTDEDAVSFLLAATFGPTDDSIEELQDSGYSQWLIDQFNAPMTTYLDETNKLIAGESSTLRWERYPKSVWYRFATLNEDQLRQRVAFGLSELFAVSTVSSSWWRKVWMHASYMDILQDGAFGNFRDLLEEVTYSPMMGGWLTYLHNAKANPETGSAPDENYAREIMQLFTIGLSELNLDGSVRRDGNGNPIDTYDNDDITELAKVFTGLTREGARFGRRPSFHNQDSDLIPLVMDNDFHARGEKNFLGETVPDFSNGNQSITAALDILVDHPNTAPFISKQLIQRLTTSNPSGDYVTHVANAFLQGSYTLPDGTRVGTGRRGDMQPTIAAILMYPGAVARFQGRDDDVEYGKVREPLLRFIHWARVSDVRTFDIQTNWGRFAGQDLGQGIPFRAQTVFNFFRPGYVAPGTESADAGLVAPEMQIESGTNLVSYANAMRFFVWNTEASSQEGGFYPNYSNDLLDRAQSVEGIVDYMNLIYTGNRMHPDTLQAMYEAVGTVDSDFISNNRERFETRVRVATMLAVNTIEFKTQK